MLIKAGVDISRLRPEIRKRLPVIAEIYADNRDELVITATYEGTHSAGSLHYANLAIDIRRPGENKGFVHSALRDALGVDYDIVFHPSHIHIEYDPK